MRLLRSLPSRHPLAPRVCPHRRPLSRPCQEACQHWNRLRRRPQRRPVPRRLRCRLASRRWRPHIGPRTRQRLRPTSRPTLAPTSQPTAAPTSFPTPAPAPPMIRCHHRCGPRRWLHRGGSHRCNHICSWRSQFYCYHVIAKLALVPARLAVRICAALDRNKFALGHNVKCSNTFYHIVAADDFPTKLDSALQVVVPATYKTANPSLVSGAAISMKIGVKVSA